MEISYVNLLVDLAKQRVEFMAVGGLAVDLSGFSRMTADVDILVEDSPKNSPQLLQVLSQFGSGSATEPTIEDFTRKEGCIRVNEQFPLDIFTLMNGKTYTDFLPESKVHLIAGLGIRYLGPVGLIALKKDSLSPKDQTDVEVLRKILEDENG